MLRFSFTGIPQRVHYAPCRAWKNCVVGWLSWGHGTLAEAPFPTVKQKVEHATGGSGNMKKNRSGDVASCYDAASAHRIISIAGTYVGGQLKSFGVWGHCTQQQCVSFADTRLSRQPRPPSRTETPSETRITARTPGAFAPTDCETVGSGADAWRSPVLPTSRRAFLAGLPFPETGRACHPRRGCKTSWGKPGGCAWSAAAWYFSRLIYSCCTGETLGRGGGGQEASSCFACLCRNTVGHASPRGRGLVPYRRD